MPDNANGRRLRLNSQTAGQDGSPITRAQYTRYRGRYGTSDVALAVAALLSDTLAELVDEREAAGLPVRELVPLVWDARELFDALLAVVPSLECEAATTGGRR